MNRVRSMPLTDMRVQREGRRMPRDLRARRHEHGYRHCHRLHGFHPHRGFYRPGFHEPHRERRLPGGGYRRDHPAVHQAQLPGKGRRGPGQGHQGGVLHRPDRTGRGRCSWTSPRTSRRAWSISSTRKRYGWKATIRPTRAMSGRSSGS